MFLLDLILELLYEKKDWCSIEEIANEINSSELETKTLLDFLAQYSFVTVDAYNRKAKINPKIYKFLEEIMQVEMGGPSNITWSERTSLSNCRTPQGKTSPFQ